VSSRARRDARARDLKTPGEAGTPHPEAMSYLQKGLPGGMLS